MKSHIKKQQGISNAKRRTKAIFAVTRKRYCLIPIGQTKRK